MLLVNVPVPILIYIFFNGGHPVVRHDTNIYKYLRQYTTIFVTNVTLHICYCYITYLLLMLHYIFVTNVTLHICY